jgi:hypothetical protein
MKKANKKTKKHFLINQNYLKKVDIVENNHVDN